MVRQRKEWKIISVGGSIIIPKTGFDIEFLKKFRSFLIDRIKQGERFILIVGGGATARVYQAAARQVIKLTEQELDWIGIYSLRLNAEFVRLLLGDYAYPTVLEKPKVVKTEKPIIIASAWKPGCSTDYDAVVWAKRYGANEIINLSNIEYVYDQDPRLNPSAKKIERIDWRTFRREIVGNKWKPGKNVPFDPIASRAAERLRLTVKILKGTDLTELQKALDGGTFRGTVIVPHCSPHHLTT